MITSQLDILNQGKNYLNQVSESHYAQVHSTLFSSSAGTHMRHVLDHYLAIKNRKNNVINYNVRQRFSEIESRPSAALAVIEQLLHWLNSLGETDMQEEVSVISEVDIAQTKSIQTASTLARELVFVSSHAVHHFAIIKIMATLEDIQLPEEFGIAPATATFQRQRATG